jgi:hypothetical protein
VSRIALYAGGPHQPRPRAQLERFPEQPGDRLLVAGPKPRAKAPIPATLLSARARGIGIRVAEVVTFVVMLGLFLALYEFLRRRAARASGVTPPVQWRWLAAITGAAALALIVGLLTR